MIFADFTYYSEDYGGRLISEKDFDFLAAFASDMMIAETFGRLAKAVPEEFIGSVRRCCCELAESIYRFGSFSESGSGSENAGGEISSEKIGQYSITYSGKAGQISALLSGENAGLKTLCSDIIYRHLAHTGLLYKGVDC